MNPKPVEYPTAKALTEALDGRWDALKRVGKARCPAHDDSSPSLDIEIGDNGKVLFTCRAGCSQGAVLAALKRRGLWPDRPFKPAGGPPKATIVATYSYQLNDGAEHFQVVRMAPKDFRQRYKNANGKWVWKAPDEHRYIPYRLPEVAEAIAAERPIFIVEGEKDADNLGKLGIVATCNAGGARKWRADHASHLKDADVIIVPDNDEAGREHANQVRRSLRIAAARVRVLELPGLPEKGDVSDWIAAGGTADHFWRLVETAARDVTNVVPFPAREAPPPAPTDEGLPRWKAHWAVEPWPELVDGAEFLAEIKREFETYMVLPPHASATLALWTMHAWTIEAFDISPFLLLSSPTKRCGKTTLLAILLYLMPRSVLASNISAAAVFRFIEDENPALLIDEADSFIKDNEPMRNVLNSGHTRSSAIVIRCEGEGTNMKTRAYSTWCPKVIAGIKDPADTILDRSIKIAMRRKQKGETVARLRHRDNEQFVGIRRKAARWAADNVVTFGNLDPEMPEKLDDRAADNWRALFAIAQAAGGEWPKVAREAALAAAGASEDQDRGVNLLGDIRHIFQATRADSLTPQTLTAKLIELEDAPWAEWRQGKPISFRGVAFMLKPYGIKSVKVRGPADYFRADFEEAWGSYLPPLDQG